MPYQVLDSEGKPIQFTNEEQRQIDLNQQYCNELGYEIDITTLTSISKSIVEQKFYEIAFADYVPVRVGEGSFTAELLTYLSYQTGGDFEQGIINTAADNAKIAEVSAGISSQSIPIINWAKQVTYSIFDLKMASKSGNWDLITAKEKSRKTNWDLGLQKVAFWGSTTISTVKGLLTLSTVNANTAVITKFIKDMTAAEFQALLGAIISAYRTNSNFTAYPNIFIIPENDYNGLGSSIDEEFPLKSRLERLYDMFILITGNKNFKIKGLAYASKTVNANISGLNKNRYVLMNYNDDTVRMDIPTDYTNTLANTLNNIQFFSGAFGQFTGVQAFRPLEVLYFDHTV